MRYILAFATIMSLLMSHARGEDYGSAIPIPAVDRLKASAIPVPVKTTKTLCDCAFTGDCTCWVGECSCNACGLGGAAKQAPKASASRQSVGSDSASPAAGTVQVTPAPDAATRAPLGPELGSFGLSPPAGSIRTSAPGATFPGVTSSGGCASGNCPAPAKSARRGIFGRDR